MVTDVCKKNQSDFDRALQRWLHDNNDADWKQMFLCVHFACNNIAKKLVKGLTNNEGSSIHVQDLEDKATEATINVMRSIQKNRYTSATLSSFCYLFVYGQIFGIKQQRIDQSVDMSLFENYAWQNEYDENGSFVTICQSSY